jgi:hypothetical protein
MTNYVKSTNFATKDNLASGDPLKIVKGTEINTEYDNIAIAVATKADVASPTFTGTTTIATLALTNDLPVTDGGTGASTAANARTNLSAASSGANSDITSITGLTTALTVPQGGTGLATLTANNVVLGNGTSNVQFVAPSTSGNLLTSNGTTWTSAAPPAGGVTSAVAGNGIAVSGATGAVTISAAAPSYGSVGSYIHGRITSAAAGITAGTSYAAGGGASQVQSSINGFSVPTNNLSGTWRNMGGTNYDPCVSIYESLFVRVS